MKVLALAWEYLGGDVVMGALAGKAALTLARGASTHDRPRLAYTIARLIGMLERQRAQEDDPDRKRPASDVSFTSKTLLIIDEAGMLDTPSLHKLLSLLPEGARLLFAGDQGQLPPVGIGKFFHDLVAEGSRVATLTKVLRQASDSAIPLIAAQVRSGSAPTLAKWNGESKGVYLVPTAELLTTQRRLRNAGELMVVAAKKATVADINDAEAHYRRGPRTPVRRLGPLATVAVGDPVVMTTNRYQDGLFNGLLGVVKNIDGAEVTVLWDGEPSLVGSRGRGRRRTRVRHHVPQGSRQFSRGCSCRGRGHRSSDAGVAVHRHHSRPRARTSCGYRDRTTECGRAPNPSNDWNGARASEITA
jgi:exodeoxyribonuclease V alpha subunit